MPPEKFRVALVQMSCGPDPEKNLEKAQAFGINHPSSTSPWEVWALFLLLLLHSASGGPTAGLGVGGTLFAF